MIPKEQLPTQIDPQLEIIDIEEFTKKERIPSEGKWYRVRIGSEYYIFLKQFVTGLEILHKAGITAAECHWLYQKLKHCDFEKIDLVEKVNLAQPGIEYFIIKPAEVFHYFVDNERSEERRVGKECNQILEAAGLIPVKDYYLVKINADGSQESYVDSADTPIKMVCPAVKFVSVFRGETPVS